MSEFEKLVKSFHGRRIAVVGDLVVDRYIHGNTRRISREAPVLIVREEAQEARMGGAANVVANIHALGGEPVPVGLIGADDNGNWLLQALANRGISPEGVIVDPNRFTTTKTRVLAGGRNTVRQQMLRVDRINDDPVTAPIRSNIIERLRRVLTNVEALVVSDYREGVVEEEVFEEIQQIAAAGQVPVYVDARRGIERFRKAEALVPSPLPALPPRTTFLENTLARLLTLAIRRTRSNSWMTRSRSRPWAICPLIHTSSAARAG